MISKICIYLFLGIILCIQCSCVSLSTLQSARTVGKDTIVFSSGFSIGRFFHTSPSLMAPSNDDKEVKDIEEVNEDDFFSLPVIEMQALAGVLNNFDVNSGINTAGFISVDFKYQFIGDRKSFFAASIGAGAAFSILELLFALEEYNLTLPLYLSVHPNEKLSIYTAAGYTYAQYDKFTENFVNKNKDQKVVKNIYGFSYGLSYGEKNKFLLEISHFDQNLLMPTQFTFGYAFRIAP